MFAKDLVVDDRAEAGGSERRHCSSHSRSMGRYNLSREAKARFLWICRKRISTASDDRL